MTEQKVYRVGKENGSMFATIQSALDKIKASGETGVTITIAAGVYREKLVLDVPGLRLAGPECGEAKIVYNDSAKLLDENGHPLGTFRTAAVRVSQGDITLENLIIENDAGPGEIVGQAVALHVAGDRCTVKHCRLLAHQDTLLVGPETGMICDALPCGRRAYFGNCLIEGNTDFIFGSYAAWFERCTLHCVSQGMEVNAMIAAPNTPQGQPFGFVFNHCTICGNCETGTVYLGRPWRPFGRAAFLHCTMDESVHESGWLDWDMPFRPVWDGLCETADTWTSARHKHCGKLTQGHAYTIENVICGQDNWRPWET